MTERDLHAAITDWHERLLADPATQDVSSPAADGLGPASGDDTCSCSQRIARATEHLCSSLEGQQLPDSLIDGILAIVDTFTTLCGASSSRDASGPLQHQHDQSPLNPAKLKLLKAVTGLPMHTTSIGRRASASYCVYESMGGWETLSAAVEALYNRMRGDRRCAALFAQDNEQQLKTHLLEFLSCALGGRARFASSQLLASQRDQLRSHGLGADTFDLLLQHMKAVLDELGLQPEIAASAIALLRCHKSVFEKRSSESSEDGHPAELAAGAVAGSGEPPISLARSLSRHEYDNGGVQ